LFLTGTLLNVVAVLIGTTIGLLVGSRMPARMQTTLTDGLGLFVVALGLAQILRVLLDSSVPVGHALAILAGLLVGAVIGELLRLQEGLDGLGDWFQRRLARGDEPSRISQGFVTASLVFCVGPLTILGSIDNGLTGGIELLAVKSLLDGVAAIAFAAALGAGVYLSAIVVFVVQGLIALAAYLLGSGVDPVYVSAASAVGGLLLVGVGLRLLDIRQVRVVSMLPALFVAPLFVGLADAIGVWWP
jgi:uncharacterized membrane protein YqgA involved in biofilm formation